MSHAMDKRTHDLLSLIIDQYISAGRPIGSLYLVEKLRLSWSSATIRNIMALLEEEGYMYSPHSSAGRVPTESGYRSYVESLKNFRIPTRQEAIILQATKEFLSDPEKKGAWYATLLSNIVGELVFITTNSSYCIKGFGHLSQKVEFEDETFVESLFSLLDSFEGVIQTLESRAEIGKTDMWIGTEHTLSSQCSLCVVGYRTPSYAGFIGILGPLRMNYSRNMSVMKTIEKIINNE